MVERQDHPYAPHCHLYLEREVDDRREAEEVRERHEVAEAEREVVQHSRARHRGERAPGAARARRRERETRRRAMCVFCGRAARERVRHDGARRAVLRARVRRATAHPAGRTAPPSVRWAGAKEQEKKKQKSRSERNGRARWAGAKEGGGRRTRPEGAAEMTIEVERVRWKKRDDAACGTRRRRRRTRPSFRCGSRA